MQLWIVCGPLTLSAVNFSLQNVWRKPQYLSVHGPKSCAQPIVTTTFYLWGWNLPWRSSVKFNSTYIIKLVDVIGKEVDNLARGGLSHGWTAETQSLETDRNHHHHHQWSSIKRTSISNITNTVYLSSPKQDSFKKHKWIVFLLTFL